MSKVESLEPCPFCGSSRVTVWNIRDGQQAICKDCHSEGAPAFNGPTSARDRAVAAWNRRPALSDHRPPVEGEPPASPPKEAVPERSPLKPLAVKVFFPATVTMSSDRARWYIEGAIRGWWQKFATENDPIRNMRHATVVFPAAPPSPPVEALGVREAVERLMVLASLSKPDARYLTDWEGDLSTFADLRLILSALSTAPLSLGNGKND